MLHLDELSGLVFRTNLTASAGDVFNRSTPLGHAEHDRLFGAALADPVRYEPSFDFSDFETLRPGTPSRACSSTISLPTSRSPRLLCGMR
jgi:hypothetical protein